MTPKQNATPAVDKRKQWMSRALLVAGAGVPLGVLAIADPAAAESDFDPAGPGQHEVDIIDPTGRATNDPTPSAPHGLDIIDPSGWAYDRIVATPKLTEVRTPATSSPKFAVSGAVRTGVQLRFNSRRSVVPVTEEGGWGVTPYDGFSLRVPQSNAVKPRPISIHPTIYGRSYPINPARFDFFGQR